MPLDDIDNNTKQSLLIDLAVRREINRDDIINLEIFAWHFLRPFFIFHRHSNQFIGGFVSVLMILQSLLSRRTTSSGQFRASRHMLSLPQSS